MTGSNQPAPMTSLGDDGYARTIDRLREIGVADHVALPQLVVVGDQSSGKSSVLESVTGFAFPRAPELCTRYATQITCRRDDFENVVISIIPAANSSNARKETLLGFRCSTGKSKANKVMGIRQKAVSGFGDGTATFAEDTLKIEISGPNQNHLTVIDVPGIFRTATSGWTTDEDIVLVKNMVQSYMKSPRTIILAVVPCNVDIATQEILTMAQAFDPEGVRTMGVLTKPDLAIERAMQQIVCELVEGKRFPLRLGRKKLLEKAFFSVSPWTRLRCTKRVGVECLSLRLRHLLRDVSKKEFKNVAVEVERQLWTTSKSLEAMGPPRDRPESQRRYLGQLSSDFQDVARRARDGHYSGMEIFDNNQQLRLITNVVALQETFNDTFEKRGHTRLFEGTQRQRISGTPPVLQILESCQGSEMEGIMQDLHGILRELNYGCPEPRKDSLLVQIEIAFRRTRGPELGTFGGSVLGEVFREQASSWAPLVLQHTSRAIVLVHMFITRLLALKFPDVTFRANIFNRLLKEKLRAAYQRAINHVEFLIDVELNGQPYTLNHYFNSNLQAAQASRLKQTLQKVIGSKESSLDDTQESGWWVTEEMLSKLTQDRSNAEQVRVDIHDILFSYYKVARKRFMDVICQQVVFHFLLDAKDGPLQIFCPDLIMGLEDSQLRLIAGEDSSTREARENLTQNIEVLRTAAEELRNGSS
ncbi:Interferon-induced GTP-binding protein Mx [Colletotrichum fructicola]|nr:Interferon-induced GTP-binding protein Mx [Colletotrichum fructicola]KAF4940325.1 Interferon-induced GTP-binding protein Mx [Colletotrichum fructicola]